MRQFALVFAALFLALSLSARADDTQPPLIRHTPVSKAMKGDSVTISADMEDESEIFAPTLYFRYPGAKNYSSIPMAKKGGTTFTATIQATADVEYWIEAYDEFGNGPTREGSPDRPHKVTVAEKAAAPKPVAAVVPKAEPPPVPPPAPAPAAEPEPAPAPEFNAAQAVETLPPPAVDPAPIVPSDTVIDGEQKPIYKEWWFIGGSVVAVAAIATVAVIALQPSPVYQNSFSASFKRPATP